MLTMCPGGGIELEVLIEELMGPHDHGENSHAHDDEGQPATAPQSRVIRIGGGMPSQAAQVVDRIVVLITSRPARAPFSDPARVSGLAPGAVSQPRHGR